MISLKAFLPFLSRLLELSPAALYERQRALVRLDLLPRPSAPGRNSGAAMATPDSVAMMLIAVLATDNLSEMDSRIKNLAKKKAIDPHTGNARPCPVTGEFVLQEALTVVLSRSNVASNMSIEVLRKAKTARFVSSSNGVDRFSDFGQSAPRKGIELKATFGELGSIARELEGVRS